MRNAMLALPCLTLAFGLSACGGDEESGGASVAPVDDTNTVMAAATVGQQSTSLTTIMPGADASAGQGPITQVGSSIQSLVGQYQQVKARAMAGGALTAQQQAQVDAAMNQFSFVDGKLTADITWSSGQAAIHYVADMTIGTTDSGSTIDGTFDMDFSSSNGGYDVQYDYSAAYAGVTISAGCVTGGKVDVQYDIALGGAAFDELPAEARSQIAAQNAFNGKLILEFGPTCGEVKVQGT
jgi:hypothetical protein